MPSLTAADQRAIRQWVAIILCILLFFGVLSYKVIHDGLPWLTEKIIDVIPRAVFRDLGRDAAEPTTTGLLKDSSLPETTINHLRATLEAGVRTAGVEPGQTELYFRACDCAPNAFALPGGVIVITDDLVALMATDEQLLGVFLHELGHAVYQHPEKQLVRGSLLFFAWAAVSGDVSLMASLGATTLLEWLQSAYSREAEMDADAFAAQGLIAATGDESALKEALIALAANRENAGHQDSFFSSHPGLEERLEALNPTPQ